MTLEYVPAGQLSQYVEPGELYVPLGHKLQFVAFNPEKVPAPQSWHSSAPTSLVYLPASQSSHCACPVRGCAVPAPQSRHDVVEELANHVMNSKSCTQAISASPLDEKALV